MHSSRSITMSCVAVGGIVTGQCVRVAQRTVEGLPICPERVGDLS
jgi:hypothetical protein